MKYCLCKTDEKIEAGNLNELNSFQFSNSRFFPPSYKEFVRQYGYGKTCGEFLVYIPMGDYCDDFVTQSDSIKNTYCDVLNNPGDIWFDLEPDANIEILKRLVPFSKSENGFYLFWDIESGKDEMDIYITDFNGLGFIKAASDLYEFFEKVISAERYKEAFPLFRESPLPATFEPLTAVMRG